MLDLIKRSLFKIINEQGEELSLQPNNQQGLDLEFTSLGSLWLFRYDCIVSAEFPQMALTLRTTDLTWGLSQFTGSYNQVLDVFYEDESD